MALVQTLRRQRQADLCEFKACLVYRVSSRTARTVKRRNPVGGVGGRTKQRERKKGGKNSKVLSKQASH